MCISRSRFFPTHCTLVSRSYSIAASTPFKKPPSARGTNSIAQFFLGIAPRFHSPTTSTSAARPPKSRRPAKSIPGLLIFRGVSHDDADKPIDFPAPLFVFVVGEAPTSGIRKKQFQNAIKIMKEIRKGNDTRPSGEDSLAKSRPLLILGPSSSGSLRSLKRELSLLGSYKGVRLQRRHHRCRQVLATLQTRSTRRFTSHHFRKMMTSSATGFSNSPVTTVINRMKSPPSPKATLRTGRALVTDYHRGRKFRKRLKPAGEGTRLQDPPPEKKCSDAQIVRLRFPREISYFRAAYQNQTASQQTSSPGHPGSAGCGGRAESRGNRNGRRCRSALRRSANAGHPGSGDAWYHRRTQQAPHEIHDSLCERSARSGLSRPIPSDKISARESRRHRSRSASHQPGRQLVAWRARHQHLSDRSWPERHFLLLRQLPNPP